MQRTFIVSAFLLGAVTFTQAEDATQEAAGMGLGTFTCAQFGNQYQGSPSFVEEHYFAWAQGFMTGLNFAGMRQTGNSMNLNSLPVEQQQQAIRSYCNYHPLSSYMDAVLDLYDRFSPNKAQPVQKSY